MTYLTVRRVGALAAIGAVALASCSDIQSTTVTASEYGDRWPLLVSEAKLFCNGLGERYLAVDGVTYALNGKALSAGMQRPDPILKDPEVFNLADLIERAGALCR